MANLTPALSICLPKSPSDSLSSHGVRLNSHGALPLKKRKLFHIVSAPDQLLPPLLKLSDKPEVPVKERDSPLAILAAASGVLAQMNSAGLPSGSIPIITRVTPSDDRRTPPPFHGFPGWTGSAVTTVSTKGIGPSPVTPLGTDNNETTQAGAGSTQRLSRIHYPPLSAPLPNGCHGRTSRNNSFCRRTPCYNGSIYCKLHYQQYVVRGSRSPLESISESEHNSSAITPHSHQDKRFTGAGDDVRCIATTTRGRVCAYVCVTGTKYCHLHATYETNPPPRRGGGSNSTSSTPKPRLSRIEDKLEGQCRINGCPTLPDLESSRKILIQQFQPALYPCTIQTATPSSISSDDSLVGSNASVVSSDPDSSHHVLLSSISSDQWLDRKVKIAAGPFVNRVGVVEKWGNGWVTVRIHGGLTHNRRSVELYLLPQGSDGHSEENSNYRSISPAMPLKAQETIVSPSGSFIVLTNAGERLQYEETNSIALPMTGSSHGDLTPTVTSNVALPTSACDLPAI